MKKTIIFLIALAIAYGMVTVGYDRGMTAHCETLKAQAVEFNWNPDYFITQIDHDECENVYGITINAQVRNSNE